VIKALLIQDCSRAQELFINLILKIVGIHEITLFTPENEVRRGRGEVLNVS